MAINDFNIGFVAELNPEESKKKLNEDIGKIQKSLESLKLKAELDSDGVKVLETKLHALKIGLTDISISKSALNKMVAQVNSALKNINISDISIGNVGHQAQQVGQHIGKLVSDNAERAIENVSSKTVGRYFRIDPSTSNQFRAEMEKLVSDWTNAKGELTDIKIDTRTSYDKESEANITRLHQATITYKNELDEVIKKTIAWRQIGTTTNANGEEEILRGFVEVAGQYSKSLDAVNTKTDSFIDKQRQAVASAKNSLSTIESKLNDKGANKTLANTDFDTNGLNQQLDKVRNAITALENANKNTFTQAKIDVDSEITSLNNLITTLRNAEYAATSLRTKDISTVKIDEGNNLNAFVQKMEQSGHYTDELKQKVSNLKKQLNSVFDADTLTSYLNGLSNLQSEFKAIDAIAKTTEKATKLQTNIDAEKKILQVYSNELKEAGVLTGEVKQKIQNIFHSLSKVDSQNGLISWRAELKGVKAETDAVLKAVDQVNKIQLLIDTGAYDAKYNDLIAKTQQWSVQSDKVKASVRELEAAYKGFDNIKTDEEKIAAAKRWEQAVKSVTNATKQMKLKYATDDEIAKFHQQVQEFYDKNTATHSRWGKDLKDMLNTTCSGAEVTREKFDEMHASLLNIKNTARQTGKLGKSFFDTIKSNVQSYLPWVSMAGVIGKTTHKIRTALTELKEVDTYLIEISKANDRLSKSDLTRIGNDSFATASKYGKKSINYLSGVQEASRAGYEDAEGIAELSVAAQGAGDMTAELANQMIIATDKAYKMNGSVTELRKVLDGVNFITNHNAVSMTELSEGMSIVGSTAASFGVNVNELAAALGTMSATTQQSGSEVARAFKAILLNIRQVSDSDEGIDAEGLTKYEKACNALGVSLKETKDGVLQLRDPMEVLKELSIEYNKLSETDMKRTNLLNAVGSKLRSTQFDALLRQWDTYEAMLQQYQDGVGSMAVEAEKTANSWEGSMNRLSNTWTSTVNNIANSDTMITGINAFHSLLEVVNKVTDTLGPLGSIGLGAGLFAGLKNLG